MFTKPDHLTEPHFCGKIKTSVGRTAMAHYDIPPTIQNEQCDRKSTWDIMRMHDDFTDFKYKKVKSGRQKFAIPQIRPVIRDYRKIVFIYDTTSGSDSWGTDHWLRWSPPKKLE